MDRLIVPKDASTRRRCFLINIEPFKLHRTLAVAVEALSPPVFGGDLFSFTHINISEKR